MKYLEISDLKRIRSWAKIIGVGTLLYGVISIIMSFFTSFMQLIPAIISIFIGKLLYDIGHEAGKVLNLDDESISFVEPILQKYSRFLTIIGIVMIITICAFIIFFIIVNNYL